MFLFAILQKVAVDKFASVVRIQSEDIKRQEVPNLLYAFKYVYLRLIYDGNLFGSAGADIGHIQGETIISGYTAAVMSDQIHFKESGLCVIPIGKGAYRYLAL